MAKNISLIPSWTATKFPVLKLSPRLNFQRFNSPSNAHTCLYKYPLASKIMLRNLPYSASESRLLKEFSKFGNIAEVKVVKDEKTNRPKGFAFIQYTSQEDAMLALDSMDQQYFDGRTIFIDLARPGAGDFSGYPITSGPPEEPDLAHKDKDLK